MLTTLLFLLIGIVQAQSSHPLYPVALSHVLGVRQATRDWLVLSDEQQNQIAAELQKLIQEAQANEARIQLVETLVERLPSAQLTATEMARQVQRLPPFAESRKADRDAAFSSVSMLPQARLRYLEQIAQSLGHVLVRLERGGPQISELRAIASRLILESELTARSAEGQAEQVSREAGMTWAAVLLTGLFTTGVGAETHFAPLAAAGGVTILTSLFPFVWNVSVEDATRWRPFAYFPGAYPRSARKVAASLRRRFWIDVELALLQQAPSNSASRELFGMGKMDAWVQSLIEGAAADLRGIDCRLLLQKPLNLDPF